MRISDWSSDVCSSDLSSLWNFGGATAEVPAEATAFGDRSMGWMYSLAGVWSDPGDDAANIAWARDGWTASERFGHHGRVYPNFPGHGERSEEHTSEVQSLMRISYAVLCPNKKSQTKCA